jgi:integrase/recombinase XerD
MNTTLAVSSADDRLVDLWLYGRPPNTRRAYLADVAAFLAFTTRPLGTATLEDLQRFADSLGHLAPSSKGRRLSAVKSLLAYLHRLGLIPANVGAALRLPARRDQLAERILVEADAIRMLALEPDPRNRAMLRLLYAGGLRVSEACALRWRDLQPRGDAGQVTIFGKGGKTRAILLPESIWRDLAELHGDQDADAAIFTSRKGGHLDPSQVHRIVRSAARRAGIAGDVSPHWLRHAHASHALDRGAPIHLVQATLGHSSIATTGRYLHARPTDSSARYLAI